MSSELKTILFYMVITGVLNAVLGRRSQIEAWCEARPYWAATIKLMRGVGFDPWHVIQAASLAARRRLPDMATGRTRTGSTNYPPPPLPPPPFAKAEDQITPPGTIDIATAEFDEPTKPQPAAPVPKAPRVPTLLVLTAALGTMAASGAGASGCAPMLPVLSTILRDAGEAAQILDVIQAAASVWFAAHPAVDQQAKVERAISDAHLALAVALRATEGTQALSAGDKDAAFAEFRVAYAALEALLKESGLVHAGGKIAVARGELVLPEPLAMRRAR